EELIQTGEETLKAIAKILNEIESANLSFQTLPLEFHGQNIDLVEITLQRFPLDNVNSSSPIDSHVYNVWVTGGFKIDFSGGFFISSLKDFNYYSHEEETIKEGENITLSKIFKEEEGLYEIGVGSTMN